MKHIEAMANMELQAMTMSTAAVIDCLEANDPMAVADQLKAEELLPDDIYDNLDKKTRRERAREITTAVTNKVKYQPKNFNKFIGVLKKRNLHQLVVTLEGNLSEQQKHYLRYKQVL